MGQGLRLEDLIAARSTLDVKEGRASIAPKAADVTDISMLKLCGLWFALTALIVLKAIMYILEGVLSLVEQIRSHNVTKPKPTPKSKPQPRRRKRGW